MITARVGQSHICTLHIFALWKCANVRSHILSLLKNVQMCNRTFCRSLKMCECAIALFVALWKNVIAQLLFWNEQMCENVRKKCEVRTLFAHSPFLKNNCAIFLKCKTVQFWNLHFFCTFPHFERAILRSHFFVALWKSVNVQSHILSLFKNVRMCDHTFFDFSNVRQNVQSHNRSFKKSECAKNVQKSKLLFFAC